MSELIAAELRPTARSRFRQHRNDELHRAETNLAIRVISPVLLISVSQAKPKQRNYSGTLGVLGCTNNLKISPTTPGPAGVRQWPTGAAPP